MCVEIRSFKTNFSFQRSKKKYNASGVVILIAFLILKFTLVWFIIDPKKFSDVTNSTMMNYGIWLQVTTTLVLSIFFTFNGLRTYEFKWNLLELYSKVDEELVNVFQAELSQAHMKKSMHPNNCHSNAPISKMLLHFFFFYFKVVDSQRQLIWTPICC